MRPASCTYQSATPQRVSRPASSVATSLPESTCTASCRRPSSRHIVLQRKRNSTTRSSDANTSSRSRPVLRTLTTCTTTIGRNPAGALATRRARIHEHTMLSCRKHYCPLSFCNFLSHCVCVSVCLKNLMWCVYSGSSSIQRWSGHN